MHTKSSLPRLAPVLLQANIIAEIQLREVLKQAQKNNQSLLTYVLQHFPVEASTISQACARYFGLPHRELSGFPCEKLPLALINQKMIQLHPVLPIAQDQQQLHVAVCDPDDFSLLEDIQYQTGLPVQAVMAPFDQLTNLINRLLSTKNYTGVESLETPAVTFVEQILTDAIHRNASDIHCEPQADIYRVRMRIDGILHEITQAPPHLSNSIISRLKILAQCDISERRLPQDGRFTFTALNGQNRDCRLSSCPTLFGEKIVVRLLDANKKLLTIEELGLSPHDQMLLLNALAQPQGLILVTGPTGSGKTITLYTALEHLNRKTHNISTAEEPVEIQLSGINQVNIHEKAGLTFASVLKAFLRQDPDIIMVGEIRDRETAEIAIRAAQTGHLVLSTLHTNSAPDTLIRLLNMGIAPFNLASSLRLIIAQRLVRKLCSHCQQKGCHYCVDGYNGRQGLFEFMPISKALSSLILQSNLAEIASQATREGMQNLWEIALQKVQQGITSMEEVYRVVAHD
jgi:type IV pilus assembly protein PilB